MLSNDLKLAIDVLHLLSDGEKRNSTNIKNALKTSKPALKHVLYRLAKANIIITNRGRSGGIKRKPIKVSLLEISSALDKELVFITSPERRSDLINNTLIKFFDNTKI